MLDRKTSKNKRSNGKFKKLNYYITFLASFFLFILYLYPGALDFKCYRQFDYLTCFADSVKYFSMERSGQCYIKDYHIKGVTNQSVNLNLDIYITESNQTKINFTDDEIRRIINNVNKTWNEYGISFEIHNINHFILDDIFFYDSPEDLKILSKTVANDNLFNDKNIDIIVLPKFKSKFLFIFDMDSILEGIHLGALPSDNRSTNLILFATNGRNVSWALTHELGHLLGSYDYTYYSGQFNLMTETGCIKDIYHTTILNQRQVDSAIATAKKLLE